MKLELDQKIVVPSHWLPGLINGDLSGYEVEDLNKLISLIEEIGTSTIDVSNEIGFTYCRRIGLYADCHEINIFKLKHN